MQLLKADERAIVEAARTVTQGGLVIYPTDTVYGVGCDPFNEDSIKKVIEAKKRKSIPLPVLGSSIGDLHRIAWFNDKADILAFKFWPGPLTLILKKKVRLPDAVTCGLSTVGVRVPKCDVAIRLIQLCGGLLIGTSANISGTGPCNTALEAANQIGEKVDVILDGGETALKKESTVVKFNDDGIQIVRRGAISENDIRSAVE